MERNRIATWWITWEDLNWPDPDTYEKIKQRAAGFAKANISAAMIFGAHFRWDWMPVFPLLHNYIKTVVDELHQYGIKVFDHHSVNLVHRYSTQEEMIHVMRDSGPHLPFSPTWEAAASWQYKGKYLNDWRMMDVKTGKPLYLAQYTGEGFCHRNPEFKEAYFDYVKYLIAETGIDGLSADDPMYYAQLNACACSHCRAELKRRAGINLPPVTDLDFWGNWDNPAWHHWLDLRFEATSDFYRELAAILPEGFMLTGCGASSASAGALRSASDARHFLQGCNYVNLELSGNTPPYKHDKVTANVPIPNRLTNSSHHQAAAAEKGVHAFGTVFVHNTASANIAWALCKTLDADAWMGTLKGRLGLPRHILETLPNEENIVGEAFGFEKTHPELFQGEFVGQLGVYFSYETRNHTLYGALNNGYPKDYSDALTLLFRAGICPRTVFTFPENTDKYPLILVSGAVRMTDDEKAAAQRYLDAGGKIIAVGPSALDGCRHNWQLPNRLDLHKEDLFSRVPEGESRNVPPKWVDLTVTSSNDADAWSEPCSGLYYHPQRICETANNQRLLELCRNFMKPMPIRLLEAKGYMSTMYETDKQITVQLLAEDYDVDIDHELDSIRFHRSRVNLLTKVEPIGIDGVLRFEAPCAPTVYTPFSQETAQVSFDSGICTVQLPDKTAYAILQFAK